MAGRVNTRFVLILSTVLVVLVGMVAGFYMVFVHRSPEQRLHAGDMAMAEGHYDRAISEYGSVVFRDQSNVEVLEKYLEALRLVEVDDHLDARDYLSQRRETKRILAELHPGDEQRARERFAFEYALIRDDLSTWDELYRMADATLRADETNLAARLYRGMAGVRRLSEDMARSDQLQPRQDLEAVLEANPDETDAAHYLARWTLFEADRLDRPGRSPAQAAELREEAVALSRQALEVDEDDMHRQYRHLQILMQSGVAEDDELEPLVRELEGRLTENPEPAHVVMTVVDALRQVDQAPVGEGNLTWGLERGRDLLEAATEARPDNATLRAARGRVEAAANNQEEAIEHFRAAREMTQRAPVHEYLSTRQTRIDAAFRMANLLVRQAALAEGEDRQAVKDEIAALADEVALQVSEEAPSVQLVRGKLALLEGELARAATLLDRASEGYGGRNPEPLRFAARVYERLGDWGAAADRLEAWIGLQPQMLQPRLELARLRQRGGDLDRAEELLRPILQARPDHPEANQLRAQILMQRGDADEALSLYEQADPQTLSIQGLAQLVRLYMQQERQAEAQGLLEQRLDAEPENLAALRMLAALDADAAERRMEPAEAAGADPGRLEQMRRLLAGDPPDLEEMLETALAAEQDPVRRQIMRAQVARRQGDREAVHEAIEEALAIDADHNTLVSLRFEVALEERDWETAEQMVERARDADLDMARGAFYRGRLALAREEPRVAVAQLRQAVSARPVYSEGFRYLGDALRASGELGDALEAYQTALDQRPDNAAAMRGLAVTHDARGEHAQAMEALRDAMQQGGMNDERLLLTYLDYEQRHGDAERALMLRDRVAEARPGNVRNLRGRAVLLAEMGRYDEAREAAEALVQEHGDDREAIEALAEVHRLAGNVQEGANVLRRYIRQRGDRVEAEDYLLLARYGLAVDAGLDQVVGAYERAQPLEDPERMQVTREVADVLFGRGEMEQALPFYEELYEQQGDQPNVALRYAETLLRVGRVDDAAAVLATVPEGPQQLALQGIAARRQGELERAEQLLSQALGQSPNAAQLYYERARVRLEQGQDTALVIEDLDTALQNQPGLNAARRVLVRVYTGRGEFGEARRHLREVLEHEPGDDASRRMLMSLYVAAGNDAAALRLLEDAEQRFADRAIWPRLRAQLLSQRGEHGRAVEAWGVAVSRSPTPNYLLGLVDAMLHAGRTDDALGLMSENEAVLRQAPALRAAQARALAAAGQADAAEQALAQAVQASQTMEHLTAVSQQAVETYGASGAIERLTTLPAGVPESWRELALAGVEVQAERFGDAVARLEGIDVEAGTTLSQVRDRALAQALYRHGAYERSREVYERLLDALPEDLVVLNNLAFIMARYLNAPEEAMPLAEKAAELAPENPHVLDTLGVVLHHRGELEEARRRLEQSLMVRPMPRPYLHLGQVYHDMGQSARSRDMVEEAIALARRQGDDQTLAEAEQFRDEMTP